jgi:hypoxanthine-DNA glycosylase
MQEQTLLHPIQPVYDQNSQILILGSFPSVKSRETAFFYGHPQNRFWKVLSSIYGETLPITIPEKKEFLLRNGLALWDVIKSCTITGSSDASIKNVKPNDLGPILQTCRIQLIITNGKTADKLYRKYIEPVIGRSALCLPSTSPANAAWTLPRLTAAWKEGLENT